MPVQHRIDGTIVEMVLAGSFSIEELLAGLRRMLEDERLPENASVLINVTESEVIPPAHVAKQVASVIAGGRERLGPRLAVVVAHSVRFGIARQLGVWLESSGLTLEPFYQRAEAVAWLKGEDP